MIIYPERNPLKKHIFKLILYQGLCIKSHRREPYFCYRNILIFQKKEKKESHQVPQCQQYWLDCWLQPVRKIITTTIHCLTETFSEPFLSRISSDVKFELKLLISSLLSPPTEKKVFSYLWRKYDHNAIFHVYWHLYLIFLHLGVVSVIPSLQGENVNKKWLKLHECWF